MRDSFIFRQSFVADLPEERKLEFIRYIYQYGINGEEPKLNSMDLAFWNMIKTKIDKDNKAYSNKLNALQMFNAYKKAVKTGEIADSVTFKEYKEVCTNE